MRAERARWEALPPHPTAGLCQLWVNVAAVQLAADGFVDMVRELLERYHLPPRSLGLEFSESTLGDVGLGRGRPLLIALRDVGCALAVDDFGTWYSSLARFEELPVDAVKLDRRFVRGLGVDLEDDSIVASVVRLAHARDLYVVAEGVESWTEGARLCELGCDRAHGFLFCGPQEASRARSMLARGRGWTPASPEALARAGAMPARPPVRIRSSLLAHECGRHVRLSWLSWQHLRPRPVPGWLSPRVRAPATTSSCFPTARTGCA